MFAIHTLTHWPMLAFAFGLIVTMFLPGAHRTGAPCRIITRKNSRLKSADCSLCARSMSKIMRKSEISNPSWFDDAFSGDSK
jgi:hypothetical protein